MGALPVPWSLAVSRDVPRGSWSFPAHLSPHCPPVCVVAPHCGCVPRHLQEPQQTLEAMLRPKVTTLPGHIQAVYVQNVVKLYASILLQKEQAGEAEAAQEVTRVMVERLPQFVQSADLEVQERVRLCGRGLCGVRPVLEEPWAALQVVPRVPGPLLLHLGRPVECGHSRRARCRMVAQAGVPVQVTLQ